jgi:sugar/nucleoside kinase (ribokinase family)
LILDGVPEELPRERELLADRMMLTLGASSAILAHHLAALGGRVGFQSRIGDNNFADIALRPCNKVEQMFRASGARTAQ